jgi:hypothetical protein
MALVGMPRGNATAWVSKPRHRSPPIRPGENNPGPDHGFKILRPGNLSRARHTSPPGKRGEADLKNDLQPVAATTRHRLHLPSRKPTNQEVQISARPNRNSRSGRHPHAQIQPSEKIKKTTCFDLILLTPKTEKNEIITASHSAESNPQADASKGAWLFYGGATCRQTSSSSPIGDRQI